MSSPKFQSWGDSFRRTGDICPLRLGMSRDELKAVLGQPSDVGATSRSWRTPAKYRYAGVEFHSGPSPESTLDLIYPGRNGIPLLSIPKDNAT